MRALITGITGFAGGHLAQVLLERGDEVIGIARNQQKNLSHLSQNVTLITADLCDLDSVDQLLGEVQPEAIYHLAGQASVSMAWADPWATLKTNIRPQLNILQVMVKLKSQARLLVVGSNEIYGHVRSDQLPVREDTPLCPDNPYGVSKVTQDVMALQYHLSHNIDVLRIRAFNHIGPRQRASFVAASFAKQIAEIEIGLREPVLRVGNLVVQRDFTDVVDVVRAYALLVEHGQPGEAYNVGTGRAYSINYLLETLLKLTTANIAVEPDPSRMRPSDVSIIYADNSKLRSQTGWEPVYQFEESLKRVLGYWRQVVQTAGLQ